MLHFLRQKWRALHLNADTIKLSDNLRFYKKKFKFQDISKAVPNLIIIGSQKCGTSSLHYYLMEHPEIYMSAPIKKAGYFIYDQWAKNYWIERGENFKSKFDLKRRIMISDDYTGQKYFGDSSTHYTIGDRTVKYDIPNLIRLESPKAKIICLVRNPFERLTSAYYHMIKYWDYDKSLDEFIEDHKGAVTTSLYYNQLAPYMDVFGDNVLILQFEDLINDTQLVLNKVYEFLDLKSTVHQEFRVFNKTSPKDKAKFSSESFDKLNTLFTEQKIQLEREFNLKLDWDFSKSLWSK